MHQVTGTVTDSSTSTPIAGANVNIISAGTNTIMQSVKTDANGNFQTQVSDSVLPISISVTADGYQSTTVTNVAPGSDGSIQYPVSLQPQVCTVSGTVTGSDTKAPIANAQIVINQQQGIVQLRVVKTDANGQYSTTIPLRNQPLIIDASADGYGHKVQNNLASGSDGNIHCDFTLDPTIEINFSVTDAVTGHQIPSSEVTFTDNYGTTYTPEVSSVNNWGLTTLTADQFPITIQDAAASGYQDLQSPFTISTPPTPGTIETIGGSQLQLQPNIPPTQVSLNLHVQDSDGTPIFGAQVYYGNQPIWWIGPTATDSQGNLNLQLWQTDFPLTLQVTKAGDQTQTVTIYNSGPYTVTLQQQLSYNTFTGTVVDGVTNLPLQGASVDVRFNGPTSEKTLTTDKNGQFSTAFANPQDVPFSYTVTCNGYTSYQNTAYPNPGEDFSDQITLYPLDHQFTTTFQVNDKNGNPISGASISLAPNGGSVTEVVKTDSNGQATATYPASDFSILISATAPGYQDASYSGGTMIWFVSPRSQWTFTLPALVSSQQTTSTGTGIASFTPSCGSIPDLTSISPSTLPTTGLPAGVTFPDGLYSFHIDGVNEGQTVTLTLTLPTPVTSGSLYWKYDGTTWTSIPINSISPDGKTITITLTDGGQGDADHSTDGVISDPGGVGTNPNLLVMPEYPLGALIGLTACFAALIVYKRNGKQQKLNPTQQS
jgi:hypothetical protein